jgi:hypothetical protein
MWVQVPAHFPLVCLTRGCWYCCHSMNPIRCSRLTQVVRRPVVAKRKSSRVSSGNIPRVCHFGFFFSSLVTAIGNSSLSVEEQTKAILQLQSIMTTSAVGVHVTGTTTPVSTDTLSPPPLAPTVPPSGPASVATSVAASVAALVHLLFLLMLLLVYQLLQVQFLVRQVQPLFLLLFLLPFPVPHLQEELP